MNQSPVILSQWEEKGSSTHGEDSLTDAILKGAQDVEVLCL